MALKNYDGKRHADFTNNEASRTAEPLEALNWNSKMDIGASYPEAATAGNYSCKLEAAEAERKSDGDGEYEAGKKTQLRRLRGSVEDSDAEVAERQKRMKETDGHPDDKEREEARNGDLKREGEVGSEESKMEPVERERKPLYEKYLEWKRRKEEEEEEEERKRNPEKVTDPYAFEARLFRQRWDEFYLKNYGCFDKKD
ncbi:cilia- and flagella-associated protein 251-like [Setaria italica]|uniref:cilia- and flagella-associated protein 251-like n=1 Tax=Setaria italica TaxID=4555 RepID=UPI000BE5A569|nr:cilia- and flagella-associated protein 251-like [Setaria italica]